MKKLLLLLVSVMSMTAAASDKYGYLAFADKNGSVNTISVENLKMTVVNGDLVVKNAESQLKFALSDLMKMYFSNEAESAVKNVDINRNGKVKIYSLDGIEMGEFDNICKAQSSLSEGVYVVKSDKVTYKLVVK